MRGSRFISPKVSVVHQVLLQDGVQRFSLLRAQVDPLKIAHVYASLVLLLQVPNMRKKSQTFTRTCTLLA